MEKLDGKSLDITKENISIIKQLFPEVITEGKINFEKLKLMLGEDIDDSHEKFEFTWHGKAKSLKLAQTPSTGTLRPEQNSSKNWDTTENLYIEGDNLEVLKLLQKSYFGKVKMIYIDPPYNTGHDFVYKDDFRDNIKKYKEITEQSTKSNPETSGRYHTDWLNMMYPRLKLARNLLREDGVIFISIDDNETSNLRKICDEIFGEDNFISQVTRIAKTTSFRGNYFAPSKDYILCYAKNISELPNFVDTNVDKSQFPKVEESGPRKGEYYRDDIAFYLSTLETRPNQRYFIECPDGSKVLPPGTTFPPEKPVDGDGVWRWNYETFQEKKDLIVFKRTNRSPLIDENGNQAKWNLYTKSYLKDKMAKGNIPRDYFEGFLNRNGTETLKKLNIPFDFAKPVQLIKYLMQISLVENEDIVLDFFSGSATTAHAVMELNAVDGGKRKFIMVQLPELTDEKSEAYKAGYKNICEIGKERIRRAGDKIVEETGKTDLDIGFKVFKLDSSNIKLWDPETANLEQDLFELQDNIKEGRTKEDLLYEILLKIGIPLTTPIEEVNVNNNVIYNVGFGGVLLCLEDEIDLDIVHEIIKLKPKDFDSKVIFKETGFLNDSVKTNAIQTLKKNGITDVRSV